MRYTLLILSLVLMILGGYADRTVAVDIGPVESDPPQEAVVDVGTMPDCCFVLFDLEALLCCMKWAETQPALVDTLVLITVTSDYRN